ncbi:MAG: hypothetical protein A2V64_07980 [Bacteroidetes bacterium RBG_13_43_22]|nr:MAG: hypothetical protein A2V64_07980 [Bacteroidetes bacterium RBG_13_43_22]
MTEISTYTSRTAKLSCSAKEFYDFATDIRNFVRFISTDTFGNVITDKDSLSVQVNIMGTVKLRIAEKTMYNRIVYRGENQQVKDFSLVAGIAESDTGNAEVNMTLQAELNPMLKMLAMAPVNRFLAALADEMEKFNGWRETKE